MERLKVKNFLSKEQFEMAIYYTNKDTSDERFNKSGRFFTSLRMTNEAILFLMLVIQPFLVILRTLVRRISFLNFIKITDFSLNIRI
jgi:hypothetical protein